MLFWPVSIPWRPEGVPFLLIRAFDCVIFLFIFYFLIGVNKHNHLFLFKQYSDQPWEPCKDAGGNLGILYCQWCQRGQKVFISYSETNDNPLFLSYWWSSCLIHVHLYDVSLSEHIFTAKLVMMTSQIPKGSKSVAARDVSAPGCSTPFTFYWSLHRIQLCKCTIMFYFSVGLCSPRLYDSGLIPSGWFPMISPILRLYFKISFWMYSMPFRCREYYTTY